jgi:hypothetical protein
LGRSSGPGVGFGGSAGDFSGSHGFVNRTNGVMIFKSFNCGACCGRSLAEIFPSLFYNFINRR